MDADGGLAKYTTNKAGAKYGTGYCDAQCPQDLKFINGQANSANWTGSSGDPNSGTGGYGSCCNEMDLWEANSISAAYTPHPCSAVGQTRCTGTDCGIGDRYASLCDADGCDFNSYRMGDTSFYGPGKTIDTKKPFTVVTQFLTSDGTATGTLSEIKRFYVQNGVTYANSQSTLAGVSGNSITGAFCDAQKALFGDQTDFQKKGGLATMGAALAKGMVLVMSIWDDHGAEMRWLDAPYPETADPSSPGVSRGTCAVDSGVPTEVETDQKSASVTYSNIKWGPINSTFASGSVSGGGSPPVSVSSMTKISTSTSVTKAATSSSATKISTSTKAATTTAPATGGAAHYSQCGGIGWAGATSCASGYTCKVSNPYYSQCL
jgi:cellulose 1,4-beta-cellobiosidase